MYPSFFAASRTRCAHASLTRFGCLGRLSTRLAVVRLTPATFATSDRLAIAPLLASDPYSLPNSFLNVHDFVEVNIVVFECVVEHSAGDVDRARLAQNNDS